MQYLQRQTVPIDPKDAGDPKAASMTFRGGSTVIFNHRGEVRYVIQKSIDNAKRLARQRDYREQQAEMSAFALYDELELQEKPCFSVIHRGF